MHKDEAARGFALLANPDRVKICKMLYNKGDLSYEELLAMMSDEEELKKNHSNLPHGGFVIRSGTTGLNALADKYSIRKGYLDTLLDFIKNPCGCTRK